MLLVIRVGNGMDSPAGGFNPFYRSTDGGGQMPADGTMCQGKEIGGGMSTNNVSFSLSEIGSAMIDVEESTCVLICISHPRTQYIWVEKLYLKSVPAVFLP